MRALASSALIDTANPLEGFRAMVAHEVRCAIYTRTSSEEGLGQPFNSLEAQRQMCAAYVESQAGEGWHALSARYDDGGFSGGGLDRPALKRLFADVEQRRVDVVLVYKLDRLTRSLMDFAKIVERLDRDHVSFMSVTQFFNTANSMGRLTLNILLTFAQFERELAAERIKDKIAASKAQGIYVGGVVPMGYRVRNRRFVVDAGEASLVQHFFDRYLELGSIRRLCDEVNERGIVPATQLGSKHAAEEWSAQRLTRVLTNRAYVGDVVHRGTIYPNSHEAIIERNVFDQATATIRRSREHWHYSRTLGASALLTGLIFDENGNRMNPHQRSKDLCYQSEAARRKRPAGSVKSVGAQKIDGVVISCVNALLPAASKITVGVAEPERRLLREIVAAVHVGAKSIRIDLKDIEERHPQWRAALQRRLPQAVVSIEASDRQIVIPVAFGRPSTPWRVEQWDGSDLGEAALQCPSPILLALSQAYRWRKMIERNQLHSVEAIAEVDNMSVADVRLTLRLAFLAPEIQKAIVDGRPPIQLANWAIEKVVVPLDWHLQRARFGQIAPPHEAGPTQATVSAGRFGLGKNSEVEVGKGASGPKRMKAIV